MTTDLDRNVDIAPRRRLGTALFCLICFGIALYATFIDNKLIFGPIFGTLSALGFVFFASKTHGPSFWKADPEGFQPLRNDERTNPAYSHLSTNVHSDWHTYRSD